jgi:hypothetical protein
MYIRGELDEYQLGKEVGAMPVEEADRALLAQQVGDFCHCFGCDADEILSHPFTKLVPLSLRPYGRLYAY